jgi:hypothetical protein
LGLSNAEALTQVWRDLATECSSALNDAIFAESLDPSGTPECCTSVLHMVAAGYFLMPVV